MINVDQLNSCPESFFREYFDKYSKNEFLESSTGSLTYSEFYKKVQIRINEFKNLKLSKNSIVAVQNHPCLNNIIDLFALFSIGTTPVLLSTFYSCNQNSEIIQKLSIPVTLKDGKLKNTGFTSENFRKKGVVFLTSGSSGSQKPALLTLSNLMYSALGSNENIPLAERDRSLLCLPLFHVGGMGILIRAFISGTKVCLPEDSVNLASDIIKYKITHASMVPTQLIRYLKYSEHPDSLKALLIGGGAIKEQTLMEARKCSLPIYLTYGLTEMSSQVTTHSNSEENTPSGDLLSYRSLRIKNGAILVKGKTLFKGYINHEDKGLDLDLEKDGWFNSGDLGYFDSKGKLVVTGRSDRMFVSAGENIQPEKIEAALLAHPLISNALVKPIEDPEYGNRPIAYIESGSELVLSDLKKVLKEKLSGIEVPIKFEKFSKYNDHQSLKSRL